MTTQGSRELLLVWLLVLGAAGSMDHAYRPGRRVCAVRAPGAAVVFESFVQRVYQPFLTTCDGHRACSTYRTIYRTAYRRNPGQSPARPPYACCPGWKKTSRLPVTCGAAPPRRATSPSLADAPMGDSPLTQQQCASHLVRTEEAVSSQAGATALLGGKEIRARQMWTSVALDGAAVPSTVLTLWAATSAIVLRGTSHQPTGHSACPQEGPPLQPPVPGQEWTVRWTRKC